MRIFSYATKSPFMTLLTVIAVSCFLLLAFAPDQTSAQFLLVPIPKLPGTIFPIEIDEPEFYFIALPTYLAVGALYFARVLPVKIRPGPLASFLDVFTGSSTDRVQNLTTTEAALDPTAAAPTTNGGDRDAGCAAKAKTVFDALRCRINGSAEFDYRTLVRTVMDNQTSLSKEEKRQIWIYNIARELADYALQAKPGDEENAINQKIKALATNEVENSGIGGGLGRRKGKFLGGNSVNYGKFAPLTSSAPSSGSAEGDDEDIPGNVVIDRTIEALVTSDWKSCLSELACEVDKASKKYGILGRFRNDDLDSEDVYDENEGPGWIFGSQSCSQAYQKCGFNFKIAARSLFRR